MSCVPHLCPGFSLFFLFVLSLPTMAGNTHLSSDKKASIVAFYEENKQSKEISNITCERLR